LDEPCREVQGIDWQDGAVYPHGIALVTRQFQRLRGPPTTTTTTTSCIITMRNIAAASEWRRTQRGEINSLHGARCRHVLRRHDDTPSPVCEMPRQTFQILHIIGSLRHRMNGAFSQSVLNWMHVAYSQTL